MSKIFSIAHVGVCIGLLLLSLAFFGCLGGEQAAQNETNESALPPPPVVQVKAPSFTITSPTADQVVTTDGTEGEALLSISTQNLVLKPAGGAAKKGEGHFKVTVDNQPSETMTSKSKLIQGLSIGTHTIKVELLNNDRTRYSPAISKEVTFTVEKAAPTEYVPQAYEVTIRNFEYEPAELTVKVGDKVTFTNAGSFPRSATCFIDGKEIFDTKVLGPEQSATIVAGQVMNCEYYSVTHMAMKGRLVVVSNGVN